MWFNPPVPDDPVLDDHEPGARRRAIPWRPAVIGMVIFAALAFVVLAMRPVTPSDPVSAPAPHFVDETTGSGVDHRYAGGFEFFVGGGVAVFDCDDDGRRDLFFAGGTEPAALYRNESSPGGTLRFAAIPAPETDLTEATGAYPLDIDGDGRTDLVVLRRGANVVLRGRGDCRFEDATDDLGIDPGNDWTTAFSATWEGTNPLPTLVFGNYLSIDRTTCADSRLVRPDSDGIRYEEPRPLRPGFCTLSVLFSDWSRTGRPDLRMTNDRHYYTDGQEQLWRIVPGEPPRLYGSADGWQPMQIWGMGIASQDITDDGYPEVFLTSQGDNKLQTLAEDPAQPNYRDIALRRGATAQRPFIGDDVLPSTAWHPEFADVNNDGYADLFISKGNVEAQPDHATRDPNNLLIAQPDGTFVEGASEAGIVGYERSRGAALADLNADGLLDLVVVHRNEPAGLFRNLGSGDGERSVPMGHWIEVRLRQAAPNVDAIGAWLEVRVGDRLMTREVTVGGGHGGGQIGGLHVGLGDADRAEVRIRWPDGEIGPWTVVDADRSITIERG